MNKSLRKLLLLAVSTICMLLLMFGIFEEVIISNFCVCKLWFLILGIEQPMIYGRGAMPTGMQMVPMLLPDGRVGYVL